MENPEHDEEDRTPLRPGREEQIAIAKARKMLSRKPITHPDRVALEAFLRRRHWCHP